MLKCPLIKLNNGVEIPQLGLGVFHSEPGQETATAVSCAIESGYRHIDTASVYRNEADVGQGLRDSGIARGEVFVTSKLNTTDIQAGNAYDGAMASLDKLKLDYLDLYLIHWPCPGFAEAYEVIQKLYEQKRFRAIGVSNFEVHHLEALAARGLITPTVNQIELHPAFQQKDIKPYSESKGIFVQAWSPLGGQEHLMVGDPVILDIAKKHGKTGAQVIIRWHIQAGNIVIPKSVKKERIIENASVFDFALDADDMGRIASLDKNQRLYWDPYRWER